MESNRYSRDFYSEWIGDVVLGVQGEEEPAGGEQEGAKKPKQPKQPKQKAKGQEKEEEKEKAPVEKTQHVFQALQYLRKLCSHPALVLDPSHPEYPAILSHSFRCRVFSEPSVGD
jgi:SNF2 family DNA or RNA helicase